MRKLIHLLLSILFKAEPSSLQWVSFCQRYEKIVLLFILFLTSACFAGYGSLIAGSDGTGKGSEANAINIDSVEAYQTLTNEPNDWSKYFRVTADINFAGAGDINGIGDDNGGFLGTFDGNGHTISNITTAPTEVITGKRNAAAMFPMFGAVGKGTIKNLIVSGATVVGTSPNVERSYAAIVVGENAYGTISGCNINGTVTMTHTNAAYYCIAGTIVGANHGVVTDCVSSGSVSATVTAGTILDIGGVVGLVTGGTDVGQTGKTVNCTSTTTITVIDPNVSSIVYVGGITGYCQATSNNLNEVNNCHYIGDINFSTIKTNKPTRIGGVCGDATGVVINSSARGNIIASSEAVTADGGSLYVGGICGGPTGTATTVDNSFADCNISVNYGDTAEVGGAFGFASTPTIRNCYALGSLFDLKENSSTLNFPYGGGFAGRLYSTTTGTVTNCWCATATFGAKAGNTNIKGFGTLYWPGYITQTGCFWDTNTSGITAANTGAAGKTTAQMQKVATFADTAVDGNATYDFTSSGLWRMRAGTYPVLAGNYTYTSDPCIVAWYPFDDNSTDTFVEDIKSGTYGTLNGSTITAVHTDDANAEANMVFADANGWIHFVAGPNYAGADGCDISYSTFSASATDGQWVVYKTGLHNIQIKRKTADANHTTALLLTKLLADANITNLVTATQGGDGNSVLTSSIAHTHLVGGSDACDYNVTSYHDTCDIAVTGKIGGALSFNGTSDYIDCNQTFQSTFRGTDTNGFTMSVLFKATDGQPSQPQAILAQECQGSSTHIRFGTNGIITAIYSVPESGQMNASFSQALPNGSMADWVLVTVVVYHFSSPVQGGYMKIYKNGVLQDTQFFQGLLMSEYWSDLPLDIGATYDDELGYINFFSGSLDDVRIYNKALSKNEIRALAGKPPNKRHRMAVIN